MLTRRTDDFGCVVIDSETLRPVSAERIDIDKRVGDRIYAELAMVLERGLRTLSATAVDRIDLERALRVAKQRAPKAVSPLRAVTGGRRCARP